MFRLYRLTCGDLRVGRRRFTPITTENQNIVILYYHNTMKQLLTKEEVAKAIKDLEAQGKKVTCTSLHAALGNRGSMSTLLRLKAEIEGSPAPIADSPTGLKTFREVWTLAVTEGRQQQGRCDRPTTRGVKSGGDRK